VKVFVFADIHHDWPALEKAVRKDANLFIFLGDLTNIGKNLEQGAKILAPLKDKLWLMPGNNETAEQIKNICHKHGFIDFHQKIKKIGDYSLAGLGYSNPTPFNTPGEVSENELRKGLENFVGQKNLLLFTHAPPKNTPLDKISNNLHVGSEAIKKFIIKENPLILFCGHIHETEGTIAMVQKTVCFNPGKEGRLINL
jgi:Icc-related predicted phosphoesterase